MDKLIFKYLNNELTPEEQQELQTWLDERPEHSTTLTKLESYYKSPPGEVGEMREMIWDQLKLRMQEGETIPLEPQKRQSGFGLYLRLAAIIVVAMGLSFVAYLVIVRGPHEVEQIAMTERMTLSGQKLTTRLPDGSTVILNAESRISFPENFRADSREVELTGEAFFEVEHDPKRPFYVRFRGSVVRVLGTSFNIRTYEQERAISVAVATGKVAFTSTDAQSEVILEPNQMVSYDEVEKEMIKRPFDSLELLGWKDRILYFKNSEFDKIVKDLERWYGVKIEAERDFSSKGTFSGEFDNKSLESVLTGLSYLYEFKYEIGDDVVTLK